MGIKDNKLVRATEVQEREGERRRTRESNGRLRQIDEKSEVKMQKKSK